MSSGLLPTWPVLVSAMEGNWSDGAITFLACPISHFSGSSNVALNGLGSVDRRPQLVRAGFCFGRVLGCMLLVVALFAVFPTNKLNQDMYGVVSLFANIFIACFVNPALESPAQVVGIGFMRTTCLR